MVALPVIIGIAVAVAAVAAVVALIRARQHADECFDDTPVGSTTQSCGADKVPPPTKEDLLNDPTVKEKLKQAWEDSDDGGPDDHEEGGYIVQKPDGSFDVIRMPRGEEDSMTPTLYPDGKIGDDKIVGFFHTHPNTGTDYQDYPSDADIDFTQAHPETTGPHHFVLSPNDVYHIDNSGAVSSVGKLKDVIGD